MQSNYQIRVYGTDGQLKAVLDRFRTPVIEHRVNHVSTLQLSLYSGDPAIEHFVLDAIIEVRRRVPEAGLDWYTEYVGFHRTPQMQITTTDLEIYTSYSRGLLDLINRRSIRYHSDTEGSAKGPGPVDDIIKQYVRENAGSLATVANGRLSDGVTAGLSVVADTSQGPVWEGANAYKNLLDTIRNIGEPNKVDFTVLWGGPSNTLNFTFTTHYPQLGMDHRAGNQDQFIFAPELGNMENPSYTRTRTDEVTSCLVLGPGESVFRDTTLVTTTRSADSPWNVCEMDEDARNEDTEAGLISIGQAVLYEKRPAVSFVFQPIQTQWSTYAKHYALGDIVTARMKSGSNIVQSNVKIRAVTLRLDDDVERITLELQEITE